MPNQLDDLLKSGLSFAGFADDDHVAATHGAADQNDLQFDLRIESKFAGTEKENAAGADVASDQGDWEILRTTSDAA